MAMVQEGPRVLALSEERRRFQRVRVNLLGRYMLADRREFPCQVVDMSPGGMALIAPVNGKAGERVIAYIDHVGRLEGTIVRQFQNGFAMTIAATPRKRDKLAAQLTWLANRHVLGLPEDRRHGRVVPRDPVTNLVLPDGKAVDLPPDRHVAVGRRRHHRAAAADRLARDAGQDPGAGGAPPRCTGLRSSSPASSTPTFSKRTLPTAKRREAPSTAHSLGFPSWRAAAAACGRPPFPPPPSLIAPRAAIASPASAVSARLIDKILLKLE